MAEWLELTRGVVHPWHLDHFGHMNVRHYAPFFDDATYHLWTRLGLPASVMKRDYGVHCVTASATTNFIVELLAGDLIVIDGAVTDLGRKSISIRLRMHNADTGVRHATYDLVEVVFDPATRTSAAMPDALRDRLTPQVVDAGEA